MSTVREMERESALMDFSPAELSAQRQKRPGDAVFPDVPDRAPLDNHPCTSGNGPTSFLATGTPDQVREYARPESLETLFDFTTEYGVHA